MTVKEQSDDSRPITYPPKEPEMIPVYRASERSASGYPLHTPK